MLESKNARFLEALRAALENKSVEWHAEMSAQEWLELFRTADTHHVLPMIYEAVYACPAAKNADPQIIAAVKRRTLQFVMRQTAKTSEFLTLLRYMMQAGVQPLVVKGIICRELYPNPDFRFSSDEDILVREDQYCKCHEALMRYGMQLSVPTQDIDQAYEVPYGKPGSLIYIEVHKHLFPPDSEAYGDLNGFFEGPFEHMTEVVVQGVPVPTMCVTDHLFYLICHAFKHFLHSGFGIRQVCDIVLFSNRYGRDIDWARMLENCCAIRAEYFTAALYEIGRKHLGFDPDAAYYPEIWRKLQVDEGAMLQDLLDSGVYGDASMSRKHSSSITLNAVSVSKQGKGEFGGVLKAVLPSVKKLQGRYPYLKKHPYLLPIAWMSRILRYYKETRTEKDNHAAQSVRIGKERVELMRQYRIIG